MPKICYKRPIDARDSNLRPSGATLDEVAKHFQCSRQYIAQVEARALLKCANWCRNYGYDLDELLGVTTTAIESGSGALSSSLGRAYIGDEWEPEYEDVRSDAAAEFLGLGTTAGKYGRHYQVALDKKS